MIGGPADQPGRVGVALLVVFLAAAHAATLFVPSTWINRDGRFYTNMNVTLVEDATLEQSRFAESWYSGELGWNRQLPASFSNIALGRNGEHWPMHPWLMPVLSTPFFLAFGLPGTLVFNLLGFAVVAAGAFRLARTEATSMGAAAATTVFLLGTAILDYAYDYHVDVLLLACLATGLAAILDRQGWVAGGFIAATLVLKPTTLLLVPYALVLLAERRDLRTLRRAVVSGGIVLALVGVVNTVLFGAPWTFGYMRVLIVVDGQQTLESDVDAFSTPLRTGLARLWRGHWGVRHQMTMLALAAPGLVALARRRRSLPRLVVAVLTVIGAVFLFAKYKYEGHRFLWPALLLLVPALGAGADLLRAGVRRGLRLRDRRSGPGDSGSRPSLLRRSPSFQAAALVGVLALGGQLATALFVDPAPLLARDPLAVGALALGRAGSTDPAALPGLDAAVVLDPEHPLSAAPRFGGVLPRATLPALLLATPFAGLFGPFGLALLGVLGATLGWMAAAHLAATWVRPTLVVAGLGGLSLLPAVRVGAFHGGGGTILGAALLLLAVALHQGRRRRPPAVTATLLSGLGAWSADAPALLSIPVVFVALAAIRERREAARPLAALLLLGLLWGLGHLVLYGRPFCSPDDFLRVDLSGTGDAVRVAALERSLLGARLLLELPEPGLSRLVVPVAAGSLLGLTALVGRRPSTALVLAMLWTGAVLTRVSADTPTRTFLVLALLTTGLTLPLLVAAPLDRLAPPWRALPPVYRRRAGPAALAAAVLVLVVAGAVSRGARAAKPFELAHRDTVRRAEVHLGEVPCDFLAWEHYAWECSHFDRGAMSLTGLVTSVDKSLGGRPVDEPVFVLASGRRGRSRRVAIDGVATDGPVLRLAWAVPGGHQGGGELRVRVDGAVIDRFLIPVDPARRWRVRQIPLPDGVRERVTLGLEITPGPAGPSVVMLRGRFVAGQAAATGGSDAAHAGNAPGGARTGSVVGLAVLEQLVQGPDLLRPEALVFDPDAVVAVPGDPHRDGRLVLHRRQPEAEKTHRLVGQLRVGDEVHAAEAQVLGDHRVLHPIDAQKGAEPSFIAAVDASDARGVVHGARTRVTVGPAEVPPRERVLARAAGWEQEKR
jgi:hypothetical protein